MVMRAQEVGRSECFAVMARIRVETSLGTKVSPRPTGLLLQDNLKNHTMRELQMTAKAGAPSTCNESWDAIDWASVTAHVRRLQMRIAKATREKRYNKVKALQWLLTHSYCAKLLAVKRVTQNKGSRTAGVDNQRWQTSKQKLSAAKSLRRHGYQTLPLKRIYIPKKNGKQRPLGIPTMKCRAMQALHLLALDPISETLADKNSYGFRPHRSTKDAIEQCHHVLCRKVTAKWVLEADIKGCFDNISFNWMLDNIPMDKEILRKWLSTGYIDKGKFFPTEAGTPQGGIASPTLANMTLDGLETLIQSISKRGDKTNVIRYADDFIITGSSKELLENKIKPAVERFLGERGLTLSQEKTKITHIDNGFDFLGYNIRRYNSGKVLTKPAKSSVKSFLGKIRETVKSNPTAKTENLIRQLNPIIRGWSNYHSSVCAKRIFSYADHKIFETLWSWAKRRHSRKAAKWIKRKYFRSQGNYNWVFYAKTQDQHSMPTYLTLMDISQVKIKRHIKVRAEATPYDPAYCNYFATRKIRDNVRKC